ncbi:hypothetical protein DUI87_28672 [Hirundo rustica rustica]|uniref:Uncharacterized protein n=1 Tax=Hirundo rustica rustica TaxID=333673 RepID=A0A3M0J1X3_HIRRU|nr:hypothetical protein DUI87_28672 [Hirundo rustica rustica]
MRTLLKGSQDLIGALAWDLLTSRVKGEDFSVPVIKNVQIELDKKFELNDLVLIPEADNNLLGRDLIIALGIKITPCEGKLKIYSLTEEDNFKNLQLVAQSREEQGQWWLGETVGKGLQHQDTGHVLMLLVGKHAICFNVVIALAAVAPGINMDVNTVLAWDQNLGSPMSIQ